MPPEFAEALVRLAAYVNAHSASLEDAVRRIMADSILPYAARADHDAFRTAINSHTVRGGEDHCSYLLASDAARAVISVDWCSSGTEPD